MIEVQNVSIQQGDFHLTDISFTIPTGEYAVLMGKTGSGKTTIMEMLCGIKRIREGRIYLYGEDITDLKPAQRGIGFVPQDKALFDTMSVWDNLAFSLTIRKWSKQRIHDRVQELAQVLGIGYLLHRGIYGLSGGESQRVALGRALAAQPSVLCLDEPLSALDDETHDEMCALLKVIQAQFQVTFLHITHSLREAHLLADLLLLLKQGKIEVQNIIADTILETVNILEE